MKRSIGIILLMMLPVILGADSYAAGTLTFQAYWDNGDSDAADLGEPGGVNNTSSWEADGAPYGHIDCRPDPDNATRNKPWANGEEMENALSANGGTIMFWFRPEEPAGSFGDILFYWEDQNTWGQMDIYAEFDTQITFVFGDRGLGLPHVHTYSEQLVNDQWYHLAFVMNFSAHNTSIYLDGSLLSTVATPPNQDLFDPTWSPLDNEGVFVIAGRHNPRPADSLVGEGDYDQFEIYDGPLGGGDILASYNAGRLPFLVITSESPLPTDVVDTAYSHQLTYYTGEGVDTPTWSLLSGSLPTGLSMSSDGLISGTPTVLGTSAFTVKALSGAYEDTKTLELSIVEGWLIATPAVELQFYTQSGYNYWAQWSENPGGPWQDMSDTIAGIDGFVTFYDDGDPPSRPIPGLPAKRYYQVREEVQ